MEHKSSESCLKLLSNCQAQEQRSDIYIHWATGKLQPGLVTGPSQGNMQRQMTNNHAHTRGTTYRDNLT